MLAVDTADLSNACGLRRPRRPGVKKNKLIPVKSSPFAVYEVLNSRDHK
jgi:hypothetical protein